MMWRFFVVLFTHVCKTTRACFILDSEEEEFGDGEVYGVSCRTVASTELILSSSRSSECEIFCVGSDEDVCVSPVSVVSSLARLERLQDH